MKKVLVLITLIICTNTFGSIVSIESYCALSNKIVNIYVLDGEERREVMEFVGCESGGKEKLLSVLGGECAEEVNRTKIWTPSDSIVLNFVIDKLEYSFPVNTTNDIKCIFFLADNIVTFLQGEGVHKGSRIDKQDDTSSIECDNSGVYVRFYGSIPRGDLKFFVDSSLIFDGDIYESSDDYQYKGFLVNTSDELRYLKLVATIDCKEYTFNFDKRKGCFFDIDIGDNRIIIGQYTEIDKMPVLE